MLFAGILLVSSGTLVAVSVLLHRLGAEHRISMVETEEAHAVGMRQEAVAEMVAGSVADLLFLSELNELTPFLASSAEGNRQSLSRELSSFARRQKIYARISVLSRSGMELLRIDEKGGVPTPASGEDLRFRGDGSDFRAMSGCVVGLVYVSSLDTEDGDPHEEAQPSLRLGVGIGAPGGGDGIAGYLLIALKGSVVIEAFTQGHPETESSELLTDAAGRWLRGPTSDASARAASGGVGSRFGDWFPDEWATIASSDSGQFETAGGLFTYDTLIPYVEVEAARCELTGASPTSVAGEAGSHWKNVSWVPAATLVRTRGAGAFRLAGWDAVGMFILGTGAWWFTRWTKRRSDLHRRTQREKELLRSTLGKYIPREIRDRLLADPARHTRLGGDSQDVAVLFADIRGFTRFAEHNDPNDVVAVLNRTLTELTAPLRLHGGILDKYIGDGFLAFFEASTGLAAAVSRAVEAARVMQQAFRNLWADAPTESLRALGLGIGVSAGRVVVGNVGSEDAMDYTVVGDAVNVAARLQDLAGPGDILIAEVAYRLLEDEEAASVMRGTRLHGRREPMNVYRLRTGRRGE